VGAPVGTACLPPTDVGSRHRGSDCRLSHDEAVRSGETEIQTCRWHRRPGWVACRAIPS